MNKAVEKLQELIKASEYKGPGIRTGSPGNYQYSYPKGKGGKRAAGKKKGAEKKKGAGKKKVEIKNKDGSAIVISSVEKTPDGKYAFFVDEKATDGKMYGDTHAGYKSSQEAEKARQKTISDYKNLEAGKKAGEKPKTFDIKNYLGKEASTQKLLSDFPEIRENLMKKDSLHDLRTGLITEFLTKNSSIGAEILREKSKKGDDADTKADIITNYVEDMKDQDVVNMYLGGLAIEQDKKKVIQELSKYIDKRKKIQKADIPIWQLNLLKADMR